MTRSNNYCLILAGGNGSRLWPVSRTILPKQFIDFFGTGRSLLQQTYDRVSTFMKPNHIFIATNTEYISLVQEQLPDFPVEQILEEPVRRGTLAAVAWGTVMIAKLNPKANIFVTPADHLIQKEEAYAEDIRNALNFVNENQGLLVTGVRPSRPETGYGYIQMDDSQEARQGIFRVKSFTEKPNQEFAEMFIQEGDFLWNSGLISFKADVMLSNLYSLVPEYQEEIPRMMAEAESAIPRLVPDFFNTLPNRNIDVSILERSKEVYVQQGHFGWADMGTWASIHDDAPADEEGNVVLDSNTFLYDCVDNIIRLPKGRTAVIKGLHHYIVAEQGEILMICPRQEVAAMRKMHIDTKFS